MELIFRRDFGSGLGLGQGMGKGNQTGGCLGVLLIILVISMGSLMMSNRERERDARNDRLAKERDWAENGAAVVAEVDEAVDRGDYEKALSAAGRYVHRSELSELVSKARKMKREALKKEKAEALAKLLIELRKEQASAGARNWTDASGKFTVEAEFVALEDGVVTLRGTTGKTKKIPLKNLSAADQEVAKASLSHPEFLAMEGEAKIRKLMELDPKNEEFAAQIREIRIRDDAAREERKAKERAAAELVERAENRKKQISGGFSAWDGSHTALKKLIKGGMNDPKSFEHVETRYSDKGSHLIVMTTFRGKNAFGGVVKNWVKVKASLAGDIIEVIEQGP